MSAGEADRLDPRVVGNGEESVCLTGLSTATRRESCGFASGCLHCFVLRPARRCCSFLLSPRPIRTRSTRAPAPRPGPDILYEPLADAPQLQNASNWNAPPILVSGSTAYRGGEFLYQDWIYDDSGALGNPATNDPRTQGNSFSRSRGTYLYPTDTADYGNNAADLVELRVEPLTTSTAFRLTLNTIKDSSVVGATIAIGGTPGTLHDWPYSANVRSPAQYFLTVHGTTTPGEVVADLRDAVTGLPVGTAPTASLDMTRRQIT